MATPETSTRLEIPQETEPLNAADIAAAGMEELQNPAWYRRLITTVADYALFTESYRTHTLRLTLEGKLRQFANLRNLNGELYKHYEQIIAILELAALPAGTDEDVAFFFAHNLIPVLVLGYAVDEQVARFLAVNAYGDPRMEVEKRSVIIQGLARNVELLGEQQLKLRSGGLPVDQTLANWLRDYNSYFDTSRERGSTEEVSYLDRSENVRIVSPVERNILLKVIQLYDFVRFPGVVPRLPEQNKELDFLRDWLAASAGASAGVPAPKAPPGLREKLLQAYFSAQATQEALYDVEERLKEESRGSPDAVLQSLHAAVTQGDDRTTIAALTLLARMGALALLVRDPRFQEIMQKNVFPILSEDLKGVAVPQLQAGLRTEPDRPVWLREMLRHLLTRAANGNTSESARIGAQIESLLVQSGRRGFLGMTYFDANAGRFVWKQTERGDVFG